MIIIPKAHQWTFLAVLLFCFTVLTGWAGEGAAQTAQERMIAAQRQEDQLLRLQRELLDRESRLADPVWAVPEFGPPEILAGAKFERLAKLIGEWSFSPLYSRAAIDALPDTDRALVNAFGIPGLRTFVRRPNGPALLRETAQIARGKYLARLDAELERARSAFAEALAERDRESLASSDPTSPAAAEDHVAALGSLPDLPSGLAIEGEPMRDTACEAGYPGKLYDAVRITTNSSTLSNCPSPWITTGWNWESSPKLRTCAFCGAGYSGSMKWGCCVLTNAPQELRDTLAE